MTFCFLICKWHCNCTRRKWKIVRKLVGRVILSLLLISQRFAFKDISLYHRRKSPHHFWFSLHFLKNVNIFWSLPTNKSHKLQPAKWLSRRHADYSRSTAVRKYTNISICRLSRREMEKCKEKTSLSLGVREFDHTYHLSLLMRTWLLQGLEVNSEPANGHILVWIS